MSIRDSRIRAVHVGMIMLTSSYCAWRHIIEDRRSITSSKDVSEVVAVAWAWLSVCSWTEYASMRANKSSLSANSWSEVD